MTITSPRTQRSLFIALAVSTVLSVHPGLALAQDNTDTPNDGLNSGTTSSANGGLLANVDSNANAVHSTNAHVRGTRDSNASARLGESRVGTRVTGGLDAANNNATRSNNGVGVGSDVNSSFNSGFNGNLSTGVNNSAVGVNNSTGTGINATVGGGTAGNIGNGNGSATGVGSTGVSVGTGGVLR